MSVYIQRIIGFRCVGCVECVECVECLYCSCSTINLFCAGVKKERMPLVKRPVQYGSVLFFFALMMKTSLFILKTNAGSKPLS